jgi:hypothetical protein
MANKPTYKTTGKIPTSRPTVQGTPVNLPKKKSSKPKLKPPDKSFEMPARK